MNAKAKDYIEAVANICAYWREAMDSDIGWSNPPTMLHIADKGGVIRRKIGKDTWDTLASHIEELVTRVLDYQKEGKE